MVSQIAHQPLIVSLVASEIEYLRILVLENINQEIIASLRAQGYHVDHSTKPMSEDELVKTIGSYHGICIRNKTRITERVIKAAHKLLVIGCFCAEKNQVDLTAASEAGIPVFNSPFFNCRSVAELVIGEIILLSRQIIDRASEMKDGIWNKGSMGCWEIRGKTLGIVGYGRIGSQLSILAEAIGMRVLFYDVLNIMPFGSARQVETLDTLLSESDFTTLHVPDLPETANLISTAQLAKMKKGSYLINSSHGKVVDIPALIKTLKSGHLAGAAIDVYTNEPESDLGGIGFDDELNPWASELCSLDNVILTPHIGGSTEEAQKMVGEEVGSFLLNYLNYGTALGAVSSSKKQRTCHWHPHTKNPAWPAQIIGPGTLVMRRWQIAMGFREEICVCH